MRPATVAMVAAIMEGTAAGIIETAGEAGFHPVLPSGAAAFGPDVLLAMKGEFPARNPRPSTTHNGIWECLFLGGRSTGKITSPLIGGSVFPKRIHLSHHLVSVNARPEGRNVVFCPFVCFFLLEFKTYAGRAPPFFCRDFSNIAPIKSF